MVDVASHDLLEKRRLPSKGVFSVFGRFLSITDVLLLALMAGILLLQLQLQFVQKINWDEFFYLSHIHDAQAGRLAKTRQMGHVYLFGWLTAIPGGEISQIIIGRVAMWAIQCVTLFLIIRTALKFMPLTSALFAGLSFLGLSYVFIHGTNFRADPIAALCMMYGVYVFAASSLSKRHLISLAIALAIGTFITVKVILYAPLFTVLALWRLSGANDTKLLFLKFSAVVMTSALLFALATFLHSLALPASESSPSSSSLSSIVEDVFFSGGIFPRWSYMKIGFFTGLLPSIMMIVGGCAAVIFAVRHKVNRETDLIVLAMALPLLSFIFYRNAFPYFYGFIFPSAVILAGYAAHRLKFSKFTIATISVITVFNIALIYANRKDETHVIQAQTLNVVHEIFPKPVHYFDRNGMVSSFPKAGIFMSRWGLRNYQRADEPRFIQEMQKKVVPLLINNSPALSSALKNEPTILLAVDATALRENFIPHWGHIWIAGKTLDVADKNSHFTIHIPGEYQVESQKDIWIDEVLYRPSDTLILNRGRHVVRSEAGQNITLRWGRDLLNPTHEANLNPIFSTF